MASYGYGPGHGHVGGQPTRPGGYPAYPGGHPGYPGGPPTHPGGHPADGYPPEYGYPPPGYTYPPPPPPPPPRRTAPAGVHFVAALYYLSGVILLLAAAAIVSIRFGDSDVPAGIQSTLRDQGLPIAALAIVGGLLALLIGRRIQRGGRMIRFIVLALSVVSLVGTVVTVTSHGSPEPLSGLVLPILNLVLLNTPSARAWFHRFG